MAMLTVKQVAERLGISQSLVYEFCREGLLEHTRFGRPGCRGTIRVSEADFEAFLASCKVDEYPSEEGPLQHIR